MKPMKTRPRILVVAVSLLAGWATLHAAITVVQPAGGDHVPNSICPAIDGGNELNPDPATYLAPPVAGDAILTELAGGDSPFVGWTFVGGAALNGTLTINQYISAFVATHNSGASIKATYAPAQSDPARLRFLQMIETTDPLNGGTSPYIDPFPNDDPTNAPLPFYWTEKETKEYGNVFSDFSKRVHPPTSFVTWRGNLYISSWDGLTPGTVTVHDGIKWGFDAGCSSSRLTNILMSLAPVPGVGVTIAWPTNSESVPSRPEFTFELTDPGWTPLTNPPTLSNGEFQLTVATSKPRQFFRIALSPNPPDVPQPAYIRVPPLSGIATQGWELSLSTKADGDGPIAYQWNLDGNPLPGLTNREAVIPHAQFSHQGSYSVSVSNAAGGEVSAEALITIVPDTEAPTIVSASSFDLTQIHLTFSEPINPPTAQNPGSYQVQRTLPTPGTVQIVNAVMGNNPSTVILTPQLPLQPDATYQLRVVSGVCDFAAPPNCVAPLSSIDFIGM